MFKETLNYRKYFFVSVLKNTDFGNFEKFREKYLPIANKMCVSRAIKLFRMF